MRIKIEIIEAASNSFMIDASEEGKGTSLFLSRMFNTKTEATFVLSNILRSLKMDAFKLVASNGVVWVYETNDEYEWFKITENRHIP